MFPSEFRILTELPPSVLSMADSRLWRRVKNLHIHMADGMAADGRSMVDKIEKMCLCMYKY